MNRTTSQRAEEARRAAQSAALKAKQAQSEMFKERAAAMAAEAQKVANLRALRLAKEAENDKAAEAAASAVDEAKRLDAKGKRNKRRAVAKLPTEAGAIEDLRDAATDLASTDDMEHQG